MSKTPRTDAAEFEAKFNNGTWAGGVRKVTGADFARQIELDLAAVTADLERMTRIRNEEFAEAMRQGSALRAENERLRELFAPLDEAPEMESCVHGLRVRCRQCGCAWAPHDRPSHGPRCAYVAARAALESPR